MSRNMKRFFDIYPQVFYPSIVLIFGFILLSVLGGEPVRIFFAEASQAITQKTGWLFILGVNFFIGYSLWLAFGKFGQVRIGGPKAIPEFSLFSWFSMLFSAGMGIGLLYFGVSEPIQHFLTPPIPQTNTSDAAIQALNFTFLHYGLHAWSIYSIVGLALAYFSFNR